MNSVYKLPRLYVETLPQTIGGGSAVLSQAQAHYLKNVLRSVAGDRVRVFHPEVGEHLAALPEIGKKGDVECALDKQLRAAYTPQRRIHLFAPPLPKDRMDFLVEKAVELGATDIHPIVCERSQLRAVNNDRLRAQIVEAAEQCERLDLPELHAIAPLFKGLGQATGTVYAALERLETPAPSTIAKGDVSVFIGPPGGWSDAERVTLTEKATPLSLGDNVLRAETAALAALVRLALPA